MRTESCELEFLGSLHGLGFPGVERLLADDPVALARLRDEVVEPAADPHARPGNQNARKKEENTSADRAPVPTGKRSGKSNDNPERVISRLKRDAATDPNARALLDTLSAGDITARQAAIQMGDIKPADPARIVERQREKLTTDEQVAVWRD